MQVGALLWGSGGSVRLVALACSARVAIGLGDALVANRFLLWSIGAGAAGLGSAIGTVVGFFAGRPMTEMPVLTLVLSLFGLASASALWLAFVPPARYLAWVRTTAAEAQLEAVFGSRPSGRERDRSIFARGASRRSRASRSCAASASASATISSSSASPPSQKPGSPMSRPRVRDDFARRLRAAGLEQREVARREGGALLVVAAQQRQHEQLAEGVGVAVEGRVHEVRDVEPPPGVVVARAATESPNIGRFASSQSSLTRSIGSSPSARRAACSVSSKRVIATCRNTVAKASSSLPQSSAEPDARVALVAQQAPEHQHLAEHARGLGGRERRVLLEEAARPREVLVHAVAELVGERHHVAQRCRCS